jgi:hypothetical protein
MDFFDNDNKRTISGLTGFMSKHTHPEDHHGTLTNINESMNESHHLLS